MKLYEHQDAQLRKKAVRKKDLDLLMERFDSMPEGQVKEEVRVEIILGIKELDEWDTPFDKPRLDNNKWLELNKPKWAKFEPKGDWQTEQRNRVSADAVARIMAQLFAEAGE